MRDYLWAAEGMAVIDQDILGAINEVVRTS